jgi:hypothetical protein
MARHLFIVSRYHRLLHELLLERFHDDQNVEIILDRRRGERRAVSAEPMGGERRVGERRRQLPQDDDLDMRSHIIITLED